MSPEFRMVVLVAASLGLLLSLFLVLRDGDDKRAPSPPTATVTTSATKTLTVPEEVLAAGTFVEVVDGRPKGGVKRVEVERGTLVSLTVRSDTAAEIHVHGYDLRKDVAAGGRADIEFEAELVGRFEVELEGAHELIAELTVTP